MTGIVYVVSMRKYADILFLILITENNYKCI